MKVEVDVDIEDFDLDDIIEYVKDLGYKVTGTNEKEKQADELLYCDYTTTTLEDIGTELAKKIREKSFDLSNTFMRALLAELTHSSKNTDPDTLCSKIREML